MSTHTVPIPGVAGTTLTYYGARVDLRELFPEDPVVLAEPDKLSVLVPGGGTLTVDPRRRDIFGSWSWLVRSLDPHPGFTRHTLAQQEIERMHRRQRRGLRP